MRRHCAVIFLGACDADCYHVYAHAESELAGQKNGARPSSGAGTCHAAHSGFFSGVLNSRTFEMQCIGTYPSMVCGSCGICECELSASLEHDHFDGASADVRFLAESLGSRAWEKPTKQLICDSTPSDHDSDIPSAALASDLEPWVAPMEEEIQGVGHVPEDDLPLAWPNNVSPATLSSSPKNHEFVDAHKSDGRQKSESDAALLGAPHAASDHDSDNPPDHDSDNPPDAAASDLEPWDARMEEEIQGAGHVMQDALALARPNNLSPATLFHVQSTPNSLMVTRTAVQNPKAT